MTCIATTDQVQNPNDFIVMENILLQNINGELVAFDNICPHRGNLLQQGRGNRPLTCTYHGWTFDKDGKAITKLAAACLTKHKVTVIGKFVFINNPSDMTESLLYTSSTMKNFLGENTIKFKANLNLVVENTLETYHVRTVHKDTFYANGLQVKPTSITYHNSGSEMIVPFGRGTFHHIVVYPNLTIGITGATTYVGILSQEGDTTSFYYRLYGPNFVRQSALDLTDKVLLEDKVIVEAVQVALNLNPNFKPIITDLEPRIKHYQDWRLTCSLWEQLP